MTTTTFPVDLDNVLAVAGELRRMCSRAAKVGISVSIFKQESWDAALAHVQDIHAGRQASINSDGTFYRLLACCPARSGGWSTLNPSKLSGCSTDGGEQALTTMEPHDVDALAAGTKARELAWARDEAGDPVAIYADGTRYILTGDGATLFAVRPHLGGVSRCEEPWVRAVLAEPVNHVVTPYVPPAPIVKVKRSRRRTAQVKDAKERTPVVQEEAKSGPVTPEAVQLEF